MNTELLLQRERVGSFKFFSIYMFNDTLTLSTWPLAL